MKSKLAIERDKFLESDEGKKLCSGSASGQCLENRIVQAFLAGAVAQKRIDAMKGNATPQKGG